MKFEDYHHWTPTTASYDQRDFIGLAYASLGLVGEIGELADVLVGLSAAAGRVANQVKKISRDDGGKLSDERQAKLADEMGDVWWYLSQLHHRAGLDPGLVMEQNVSKLTKRLAVGEINGDKREEEVALSAALKFEPSEYRKEQIKAMIHRAAEALDLNLEPCPCRCGHVKLAKRTRCCHQCEPEFDPVVHTSACYQRQKCVDIVQLFDQHFPPSRY